MKNNSKEFSIAIIISFSILIIGQCNKLTAQWTTNLAVNTPITNANGDQYILEACTDDYGGAIIVWEDYRAGNPDIYVQRIDVNGFVQWTMDGVPICTAANDQHDPQIIPDGLGGAIITWVDSRAVYNNNIYAQRINSNGQVQWTIDGEVICSAPQYQTDQRIVTDNNFGAIITWSDFRDSTITQIYAQRIDSNGLNLWTLDGIQICPSVYYQNFPSIVEDGLGGAIIAWDDYRDSTGIDIYAQRINEFGIVQWSASAEAICSDTLVQTSSRIVSDGNNGAIITYWDRVNGVNYDIYAQRINFNGLVQWTMNGVPIDTLGSTPSKPIVIFDGESAIMTWYEYGDLFAQKIDTNGIVQWAANGAPICTTATTSQVMPSIISDNSGGAIIAWTSEAVGICDLYCQHVNSSGTIQWTSDGELVCNAPITQFGSRIVASTAGQNIITWYDYRTGTDADIYAQKIDMTMGVIPPAEEYEIIVFPNPSSGIFQINTSISNAKSEIAIYDELGQVIFRNKFLSSSSGTFVDLSSQAKGMYIYKIFMEDKFVISGKLIVQ